LTDTVLGLLRHGQTDWNVNFLLQGVTDIPMNPTGVDQIRVAAEVISKQQWDLIVTSPLGRALHSAEIVADALGLDNISQEPLLIERSFGIAEGLSYDKWKAEFGSLDEIPGGESRSDLISRSASLLETFREKYQGQRVLAVSHGALIRTVLSIASNNELPREGERLANASLNQLSLNGAGWVVSDYSLEPLSSNRAD
jgi:uncharacterized phosphatase